MHVCALDEQLVIDGLKIKGSFFKSSKCMVIFFYAGCDISDRLNMKLFELSDSQPTP